MGKTLGQTVGTIVGAVVGFYAGGNVVQGAALGYSLGTMADPPDLPSTRGPRLEDKQFQGSEYGADIPVLYGDKGFLGNIIYLENGEYKEVAQKLNTGGKGGSPKQEHTSFAYFATFAVALCEAVPGAQVRRIWAGAKLLYHADSDDLGTLIQSSRFRAGGDGWLEGAGSPDQNEFSASELTQGGAGFKFYDGTQTEPDPRMEAVLGVGNCPAYTGTAYIMFYDFDLTDYGNNLAGAQKKVELIKSPPSPNITLLSNNAIRATFNSLVGTPACWYLTPQKAISSNVRSNFPTYTTYSYTSTPFGSEGLVATGALSDTSFANGNSIRPGISDNSVLTFFEDTTPFNCPFVITRFQIRRGVMATYQTTAQIIGICQNIYGAQVWTTLALGYVPRGLSLSDDQLFVIERASNAIVINVYDLELNFVKSWATGASWAVLIAGLERVYFDSGYLYVTFNIASAPAIVRQFDVSNEVVGDSFSVSKFDSYSTGGSVTPFNFSVFGNLLVSSEWHLSGAIHTFRHKVWKLYDYDRNGEALEDVVTDLCNRAGIAGSSLNLTALSSDTVRGFLAAFPGSARANLAPLQTAYIFDLIEDGYTLKAVKRGGNSIKTITQGELDARALGAAPGVLLKRDREMNNRLPSRYTLTYVDYNREYENNSQSAEFSINSENERSETLPLVLTSSEAIQLADILGRISHVERDVLTFTLSLEHIDLKTSDIISLETFPGNYEDARIEDKTELEDQRISITAKITDASLYSSTLIGADGIEPSGVINFIGESTFVPLDIPMILDTTDYYGFTAAMYGPGSYPGGVILKSLDGEQTWEQLQGFAGAVASAQATDMLPAHDGYVLDRDNTLNVKVLAGDFDGVTETQMMTGQNVCAYGDDGRWELIQFTGATLEADGTYTLDTFVRGARGTEQYTGTHAVGDKVILLSDPDIAFMRVDASELAVARDYKAVTVGQQAEYVNSQSFTYNAVNLKCLSGVHAMGVQSGSDWIFSWTGRTRYSSSYWVTGNQPDNEDTISYEVDIMNGSSVVRTLTNSSSTVTYTSAQQTTDFGSPQSSVEVNIYQISNIGARGYALNETFTA